MRSGSEKETARAISLLEERDPLSREIMQQLYQHYTKAYIIGITGPAGSGKSSLLNLMLKQYLKKSEEKIAVIAVDPSAQQSGGAFLGDRIRMKELFNDQRIFIRSMASRGSYGGVNAAVYDTAVILAAAGYQRIIIETVGVGQTEIDIVSLADTTLVVTVPEAGDEIQIYKSELMEIGDIFILNKADLPQAVRMEVLINSLFSLKKEENLKDNNKEISKSSWKNKLVKTSALNNQGIESLLAEVENHYNFLKENKIFEKNKKQQLKKHLLNLFQSKITDKTMFIFNQKVDLEEYFRIILSGQAAPEQLIEEFIDNILAI
ncbi:MAG: methylmalonyl Co-A mutase-associated GTPase MeaB [Halanaerobium sp.]